MDSFITRHVVLLDVRNHGDSDHHTAMNYSVMAEDLIRLADKLKIEKFDMLGHSMGAKIAMTTACKVPERIEGVIAVDAAPYDYNSSMKYISVVERVVRILEDYHIDGMDKRELFNQMVADFESVPIAHLILANVLTDNQTVKGWKSNMPVLLDSAENIYDYMRYGRYNGPFRALLAGKSNWTAEDFTSSFPSVTQNDIVYVEGAGHWVQVDKPHETIDEISKFIDIMDN